MTKIRTILKASKASADGKHPIFLRISDRGEREYFFTGFSATEKEFDGSAEGGRFLQGKGVKKFQVTRKETDGSVKTYSNSEANDILSEFESRAKSILKGYDERHVQWSLEQFRAEFVNKPMRKYFVSYAENAIETEYRSRGHYQKALIAEDALNSFKKYDAAISTKTFVDVTCKYIQGYIDFCKENGNANGTIAIRLREIRRIYNLAIRDGIAKLDYYPFSKGRDDRKVKIPRTEMNKQDQFLPKESLVKLANTTFNDYCLERTKHLFLFSFYCRGINWKDMALLTDENFYKTMVQDGEKQREVTMLQYKRSKTKGEFDIQVTPNIQRELDWFKENTPLFGKYILPIISVDVEPDKRDEYLKQIRKRFNRSLKSIAKILELPESQQDITIYSARHSFAMALQNQQKSVEIISQALGHQSVETTKHYLQKFSTTKMAQETDIDLSE